MPCYFPKKAFIVEGQTNNNGKKLLHFTPPREISKQIKLPCNQCIGCRLSQSIMWATRIMNEIQTTPDETACFITLTYNDKNLPKDYSLNHEHFKDFMKRFRKAINPIKIRYFMCGEYGDESWRPHYHAIIFGYDFSKGIIYNKNYCKKRIQYKEGETQNPYYLSEFLKALWPQGNHLLANSTIETAAYVARYCTKKINGEKAEEHYNRLIIDWNEFTGEIFNMQEAQLKPEYATMSRGRKNNRGIGYEWYQKYKKDCFPSNYLIQDGYKKQIPKYYDKILEEENPLLHHQIKIERELSIISHQEELTPKRLIQRHECKKQQANTLMRNKI